MRQEWTGRWVHYSEWEPQQPQEIITPKKDNQRVWPVRDEQAVVNVNANAPDNPLTIIGINTNNAQIQNNGFDVVTTANGVLVSAYSVDIQQYSAKHGVRFSIDKTLFSDTDAIYIGYANNQLLESSTENLIIGLVYDLASDNLVLEVIGNTANADNTTNPAQSYTYQSGDQICVSIDNTGLIELRISGVVFSHQTTSPAVTSITNFIEYFYSTNAGGKVSISTAASIYPTIIDYEVSSVPNIPPSQLDSY